MILLTARNRTSGVYVRVHLDDTKTAGAGSPDPDWVLEFTYPSRVAGEQTAPQYAAMVKAEIKGLCQAELARRAAGAGTVITGLTEGQAL